MLQPVNKLLTPIIHSDSGVCKELQHAILNNSFSIAYQHRQQSQILLILTHNYLFSSEKINNGHEYLCYCHLSFDLKFQVLRKVWPDDKTPGVPYGIRLEKDKNHQVIQFFSPNAIIINQWASSLEKKINQRNFHQLFKAKKKIGKGAFATVYLAERLTDNKMVAVKAFSKEKQFSGDKGKQSLENEIKIMRGCDHSCIMKLQGVYETQNSIYVILEYLEGPQLNEELKNGRKYTENETLTILKQILQALKHLNQNRIIHRDLKPQNIMFKTPHSLELGICDFGLATYADEEKYLFVRCGTPGFVAPEIINIKDMSTKSQPISDVFSAGIIFHYLLFGHSIFTGKRYNEVLAQNRSCSYSFEGSKYEKISPVVLDLLKKMLDKNPQVRISANQALRHEVFEHHMDIEEQSPLSEKKNTLTQCLEKNKLLCRKSISKENYAEKEGKLQFKTPQYGSFNTTSVSEPIKSIFPFQRLQ